MRDLCRLDGTTDAEPAIPQQLADPLPWRAEVSASVTINVVCSTGTTPATHSRGRRRPARTSPRGALPRPELAPS
jgi:hypothetical protein